jgi:hypothetical protein
MEAERVPMDLAAYQRRIRTGPCFVCAIVSGDPSYHPYRLPRSLSNHA